MRFKVGDKAVVVNEDYSDHHPGKVVVITKVYSPFFEGTFQYRAEYVDPVSDVGGGGYANFSESSLLPPHITYWKERLST